MSTPLWVAETASTFWAGAGGPEPFPRGLRRAIALSLPLTPVYLSRLRVSSADAWLERNGVACPLSIPDRPMRACLVAWSSQSFVFLDGADPEDEQRFSLAHELAHFLKDYWRPLLAARARLGADVLEVFDGERAPHPAEDVRALLAGLPLGAFTHFMERTADGHAAGAAIDAIERDADRLAFELLAPSDMVMRAGSRPSSLPDRETLTRLLVERYGLPPLPAMQYAAILYPPSPPAHPLLRRLGLTP